MDRAVSGNRFCHNLLIVIADDPLEGIRSSAAFDLHDKVRCFHRTPHKVIRRMENDGQGVCRTHIAVQEGHDLAAGAGSVGAEDRFSGARGDSFFNSPQDCVIVVFALGNILEGVCGGCRRRTAAGTVQEGHNLRTGAACVGAEGGAAGAGGHALFHCPKNCLIIIFAFLHVLEGIYAAARLGTSGSTVQEGYNLRTGTACVGAEGGAAGAGGHALFHCPKNSVIEIVTLLHVLEGIGNGIRKSRHRYQTQHHYHAQYNTQYSFHFCFLLSKNFRLLISPSCP